MTFGLLDDPLTQDEIADQLELHRSQISRALTSGLELLKQSGLSQPIVSKPGMFGLSARRNQRQNSFVPVTFGGSVTVLLCP